jgi:hypothetical protein
MEVNMKNRYWKICVGTAILAMAVPLSALAVDNDGCSNGTLKGDYAFTLSGQIFHPDGTVDTRAGVAMTYFDGAGNLKQDDFVMSSSLGGPVPSPDTDPLSGFHTNETGTYTVNPDCTGNATIDFPNGIVIKLMFVNASGTSIHTVVSSITLPNGTSPGTPIIRSDGRKQARHDEEASERTSREG